MTSGKVRSFQIGLEWFPERAGGLPRYYYELARASGDHMEFRGLVVGSSAVAQETGGAIIGVGRDAVGSIGRARSIRRVFNDLKRSGHLEGVEVFASHFALNTLPILGQLDKPMVLHFHGPWADEAALEGGNPLSYFARHLTESLVYRRSAKAIVLSRAFALVLHRKYGVPEDRIEVIPGGVDARRFQPVHDKARARRDLGWPADRPIILCVRRLVNRMGLDQLVDAVAEVKKSVPDVLVFLAGKGAKASEIRDRIAELGLEENVKLIGFIADEDLPAAYGASDLSIVPSQKWEGFGLIALESLACGTPALVTDVGGLPEVVGPLCESLVIKSTEAAQIAASICSALLGSSLPSEEKCVAYAQQFDWQKIVPRIAAVYEMVTRV